MPRPASQGDTQCHAYFISINSSTGRNTSLKQLGWHWLDKLDSLSANMGSETQDALMQMVSCMQLSTRGQVHAFAISFFQRDL